MKPYCVRAVRCDHRATEDEIYSTLVRITAPLQRSWERLQAARTIVVKTNMVWPPDELRYLAGRRHEHVDDAVFRCVLRLLRERTKARILVADTTLLGLERPGRDVNFLPILEEFGATYVECNDGPVGWFDVPGGGIVFGRYIMHRAVGEADAMVSVAKLKNHAFAGVTLSTKNLFGLCPLPPLGRTRAYFHHLVRLSSFLADLGQLLHPCLNIVDGLVGQSGREWGGKGHICDALIAGDHPIATDTCGTHLMGHDPLSDYPTPPFRRDRNTMLAAAEHGFGPVNLDDIDFVTDLQRPLGPFDSEETDSPQTVRNWLWSTCEQALHFRDHRADYVDRYAGNYIFLRDREVIWHGPDTSNLGSRRNLGGGNPESALWLKFVDPEETEREHFELYERTLDRLRAQPGS